MIKNLEMDGVLAFALGEKGVILHGGRYGASVVGYTCTENHGGASLHVRMGEMGASAACGQVPCTRHAMVLVVMLDGLNPDAKPDLQPGMDLTPGITRGGLWPIVYWTCKRMAIASATSWSAWLACGSG